MDSKIVFLNVEIIRYRNGIIVSLMNGDIFWSTCGILERGACSIRAAKWWIGAVEKYQGVAEY